MNKEVKVILIRHGETDWNSEGRLQGQIDIPLNAHGLAQAKMMGERLMHESISAIYSSDLLRAYQTAQALSECIHLPVTLCHGLRERNFGSYQGLTFAQINEQSLQESVLWQKRDLDFIPGGVDGQGESLRRFSERVINSLNALMLHHAGEQIAMVTHGGVLDILYRKAKQLSLQVPRTWDLGNTCVSHLVWNEGDFRILQWGDTSHLSDKEKCLSIGSNKEF